MPQVNVPQADLLLVYAVAIIAVAILLRLFLGPLRWLAVLTWNGIVGGLALLVLDFFGKFVGFHLGLNLGSALVAGVLGLPGLGLLVLLRSLVG